MLNSLAMPCGREWEEAIRKRGAELSVHESRNQKCLCPGMRVSHQESFALGTAKETQAKSSLESSPGASRALPQSKTAGGTPKY